MLPQIIFGLSAIVAADHRINQLIVGDSGVLLNKQKSTIQYPVLVLDLPTLQVTDTDRSERNRERRYSFDLALLGHAKPDDWERMRDVLQELETVAIAVQQYITHGIFSAAAAKEVNVFGSNIKADTNRWQHDVVWEYTSDNCVGWLIKVSLVEVYCPTNYLPACNETALNWASTGVGFDWSSDGADITCTPIVAGGTWLWRLNSQNTWQQSTAATLQVPHPNTQNDSVIIMYRVEVLGVTYWYRASIYPQSVATTETMCGTSYPYILSPDSAVLVATAGEQGTSTNWQGTPAYRDFWFIDSSTPISIAVLQGAGIIHWQVDTMPNPNQYILSVWYGPGMSGAYSFAVSNGATQITIEI